MLRLTTLFTLILIFTTPIFAADDDNYCLDKEKAIQWEEMARKNLNDLDLQRLHSLRIGICHKIEKGTLTLNQGITIFEGERLELLRERAQKQNFKREGLIH